MLFHNLGKKLRSGVIVYHALAHIVKNTSIFSMVRSTQLTMVLTILLDTDTPQGNTDNASCKGPGTSALEDTTGDRALS